MRLIIVAERCGGFNLALLLSLFGFQSLALAFLLSHLYICARCGNYSPPALDAASLNCFISKLTGKAVK